MTKKQAIAEAYGKFYNPERIHYSINGWMGNEHRTIIENMQKNGIQLEFGETRVRPLSLQGIEDNNGWIKIESEEDLPKEKGYFMCLYEDREIIPHHFSINSEFDRELFLEEFTHYKPIEQPKPPIY